jgi:LytS/YehU family sensor histidine kinase
LKQKNSKKKLQTCSDLLFQDLLSKLSQETAFYAISNLAHAQQLLEIKEQKEQSYSNLLELNYQQINNYKNTITNQQEYITWVDKKMNKSKLMEEKFELEKELNRSVLTSIKSQLNPHFFYNALNTIQSFVYMDDRKNASNYLGRFSKLTRTILEMSEKETISLKEEIEALTLYLELEKMRFEDSFSFEMNYQGVDAELENIPPMLIQPYVENAVKHGLLHKKGNKREKRRGGWWGRTLCWRLPTKDAGG